MRREERGSSYLLLEHFVPSFSSFGPLNRGCDRFRGILTITIAPSTGGIQFQVKTVPPF
jgi:hypothetical protein